MRSLAEVKELLTFLLENGAVHVKVGETVEAIFPPPAAVASPEDEAWESPAAPEPSLRDYVTYQPLPRVR